MSKTFRMNYPSDILEISLADVLKHATDSPDITLELVVDIPVQKWRRFQKTNKFKVRVQGSSTLVVAECKRLNVQFSTAKLYLELRISLNVTNTK